MKIRYKKPLAVDIAHVDFTAHVEPDEVVEVPDHVGESLIEQVDVWEQEDSPPRKATKAADKEKS